MLVLGFADLSPPLVDCWRIRPKCGDGRGVRVVGGVFGGVRFRGVRWLIDWPWHRSIQCDCRNGHAHRRRARVLEHGRAGRHGFSRGPAGAPAHGPVRGDDARRACAIRGHESAVDFNAAPIDASERRGGTGARLRNRQRRQRPIDGHGATHVGQRRCLQHGDRRAPGMRRVRQSTMPPSERPRPPRTT